MIDTLNTLQAQEWQALEQMTHDFKTASLYFAVIIALSLGAMLIDFVLGVTKAKMAGQKIQSYKLRKMFLKLLAGIGLVVLMYAVDLTFILCDLYNTPYLAMLGGSAVTLTEVKSWFESLSDKEQARLEHSIKLAGKAMSAIGKTNTALVGSIAEGLSTKGEDDATSLVRSNDEEREITLK